MHISFSIYPHHLIHDFIAAGSEAEMLWHIRAKAFTQSSGKKIKDMGFFIWYMPKGKKKPEKLFICRASADKHGEDGYVASIDEIKQFFKAKDMDVLYQSGFAV
jgi:hypothetical protein